MELDMIKKTLAIAVGLASTQLVMAQGFYVDEQSALRLGDAFFRRRSPS